MTKLLGIASIKGGVGKTTVAINLGMALNNFGRRVIVVDGDLLKPNIAIYLNVSYREIKDYTIHKAIKDKLKLDELVYVHPSGLKCILGDIARLPTELEIEVSKELFAEVKSSELIILDTPPGFSKLNKALLSILDAVIIVVTQETASVQDGLKTYRICEKLKVPVLGLVINRYKENKELNKEDIAKITMLPILAVIPEDEAVLESCKRGYPVVHYHLEAPSTKSFKELAAKLLGEKYIEIQDKRNANKPYLNQLLKKLGMLRKSI